MLTILWHTKTKVSFPLEDKHVVNERDAMQEKCPHVVHFSLTPDWFEANSRHQKRYSKDGKNICGCRGLLERVISNERIGHLCRGDWQIEIVNSEKS